MYRLRTSQRQVVKPMGRWVQRRPTTAVAQVSEFLLHPSFPHNSGHRTISRGTGNLHGAIRSIDTVMSKLTWYPIHKPTGAACRGYVSISGSNSTVVVPPMGDSISEGTVVEWCKNPGDYVLEDEIVVVLETDKVSVDVRAPSSGKIIEVLASLETTVQVGAPIFSIDTTATPPPANASPASKQSSVVAAPSLSVTKATPVVAITPEMSKPVVPSKPVTPQATEPLPSPTQSVGAPNRRETRVKMSPLRWRTAQRLKGAQNTAAMLTTFQECDVGNLVDMKNELSERFEKVHGVKMGLMSAFVKAATMALKETPAVNAMLDDETKEIVYHDYIDINVAVASSKGVVVPVVRDCDGLSFADIEKALVMFSDQAEHGNLAIEDIAGGTFTISNGGIHGSMLSTPIVNHPQVAAMGIHGIKSRPAYYEGKIQPRPMMYLALSYDHRVIDGREAVTFLKSVADKISDPRQLLLQL